MISDAIATSVRELCSARVAPLKKPLRDEIGRRTQDLISRGLYHSSLQVTAAIGEGERSLVARARIIADTLKEASSAFGLRHSSELGEELVRLFDVIYESELRQVTDEVARSIPDQNRKLVPTWTLAPAIDCFRKEIAIYGESRVSQTASPMFFRSMFRIVAAYVVLVLTGIIGAYFVNAISLILVVAPAAIVLIVAVASALRQTDSISEEGFVKIVLALTAKIPLISWSKQPADNAVNSK